MQELIDKIYGVEQPETNGAQLEGHQDNGKVKKGLDNDEDEDGDE